MQPQIWRIGSSCQPRIRTQPFQYAADMTSLSSRRQARHVSRVSGLSPANTRLTWRACRQLDRLVMSAAYWHGWLLHLFCPAIPCPTLNFLAFQDRIMSLSAAVQARHISHVLTRLSFNTRLIWQACSQLDKLIMSAAYWHGWLLHLFCPAIPCPTLNFLAFQVRILNLIT